MMRKSDQYRQEMHCCRPVSLWRKAVMVPLCLALSLPGCFDPVYPQLDRDERVMEALSNRDTLPRPPSPLTPSQAVAYALAHNLDAKVSEIETSYHNESAIAARRRLLPSLNLRYSADYSNHPSARWSESTRSGNQSLESSYSSDPNSRHGEVGVMWNLLDFGVGYLKSRQQGERIRYSMEQGRRVRQQVVLDVLSNYWRAAAVESIAIEADTLKRELAEQAEAVRDSVEMRILSGAEGARRELAVHSGLAELEQWRRSAVQSRLELARALGYGNASELQLAAAPETPPPAPPLPNNDPSCLQVAALQRRPELFQQDVQERIAVDEARIALLQMAPNANLSLSYHDDPDKFLEWSNWMSVGARVSWNLFNIPARLAERRMAKLQEETAKQKGLALAAGIMAQVGIAYSEWRLSSEYADTLGKRAAARARLVEALAAGERDGQTRPGEVLQERVRLLSEKAAALRANAEVWVAAARLANAIGIDIDDRGRLLWNLDGIQPVDLLALGADSRGDMVTITNQARAATAAMPLEMAGLRIVKAEDFEAPAEYFSASPRPVATLAPANPLVAIPEAGGDTETLAVSDVFEAEPPEESIASLMVSPEAFGLEQPANTAVPPAETSADDWDTPIIWENPVDFQASAGQPTGLDDMDAAWERLVPDELREVSATEGESRRFDQDDSVAGAIPSSGRGPEEIQAMSPSGFGTLKKVKNLPATRFVGPADMRRPPEGRPVPDEQELSRRRALAPLPLLEPVESVYDAAPGGFLRPMDALDGDTIRPTLRPPRQEVEPGSLRPPS